MKKKTYLTNEKLKYKFKNFFDLANFGIGLAREKVSKEETAILSDIIEELSELPDSIEGNNLADQNKNV